MRHAPNVDTIDVDNSTRVEEEWYEDAASTDTQQAEAGGGQRVRMTMMGKEGKREAGWPKMNGNRNRNRELPHRQRQGEGRTWERGGSGRARGCV